MRILVTILCVCFLIAIVYAEETKRVLLIDGSIVEGVISSATDTTITIETGVGIMTFPKINVLRIEAVPKSDVQEFSSLSLPEMLSCEKSRLKGIEDAKQLYSGSSWFFGGMASGTLLGLIGTGVITAVAATSDPQPFTLPQNIDEACYRNGYARTAKSKNITDALGGGLVGSLIGAAIVIMIVGN